MNPKITIILPTYNRKIAQYDKRGNYIKTWANAYEVYEKIGISAGDINACINGKRKSAGGFRWERRAYVA